MFYDETISSNLPTFSSYSAVAQSAVGQEEIPLHLQFDTRPFFIFLFILFSLFIV